MLILNFPQMSKKIIFFSKQPKGTLFFLFLFFHDAQKEFTAIAQQINLETETSCLNISPQMPVPSSNFEQKSS